MADNRLLSFNWALNPAEKSSKQQTAEYSDNHCGGNHAAEGGDSGNNFDKNSGVIRVMTQTNVSITWSTSVVTLVTMGMAAAQGFNRTTAPVHTGGDFWNYGGARSEGRIALGFG